MSQTWSMQSAQGKNTNSQLYQGKLAKCILHQGKLAKTQTRNCILPTNKTGHKSTQSEELLLLLLLLLESALLESATAAAAAAAAQISQEPISLESDLLETLCLAGFAFALATEHQSNVHKHQSTEQICLVT